MRYWKIANVTSVTCEQTACNVVFCSSKEDASSCSSRTFQKTRRIVCVQHLPGQCVHHVRYSVHVYDTKHQCFVQFRESSVNSVCPDEVWAASVGGPGGVEAEGKLSSLNKPSLSDLIRSTSAPETFSSWPTRRGELKPRFNYFPHVKGSHSTHRAIL